MQTRLAFFFLKNILAPSAKSCVLFKYVHSQVPERASGSEISFGARRKNAEISFGARIRKYSILASLEIIFTKSSVCSKIFIEFQNFGVPSVTCKVSQNFEIFEIFDTLA